MKVILGFIFFISSCAINPISRKPEIKIISENTEKEIGKATKEEILKEFKTIDNEILKAYIEEITQKILPNTERKNLKYEFIILDTHIVNAFAAPGGYIFLTKGLILEVEDEAELASVICHEIAHITAWHGIKALERAYGYSFITILATITSGIDPRIILQAGNLFAYLLMNGYGRRDELQADRIGVKYLLLAGYDPEAMNSFFEKLKNQENENPEKLQIFFRSHPATIERIKQIRKILKKYPYSRTDLVRNKGKFQNIIDKVFFETLQSKTELKKIKIDLPQDWKMEETAPSKLLLSKKAGPQNLPIIEIYINNISTATKIDDTITDFEKKLQLKRVSKKRQVTYSFGDGIALQYEGVDKLGRVMQYKVVYFIKKNQSIILSFYSPPEEFIKDLIEFERILRNLKEINN